MMERRKVGSCAPMRLRGKFPAGELHRSRNPVVPPRPALRWVAQASMANSAENPQETVGTDALRNFSPAAVRSASGRPRRPSENGSAWNAQPRPSRFPAFVPPLAFRAKFWYCSVAGRVPIAFGLISAVRLRGLPRAPRLAAARSFRRQFLGFKVERASRRSAARTRISTGPAGQATGGERRSLRVPPNGPAAASALRQVTQSRW